MNKDETISLAERVKDEGRSLLDGIIRQGAQKILQAALELEVEEHLAAMGVGPDGRRVAVRNGRLPSREILTGAGALAVAVPRVVFPRKSGLHKRSRDGFSLVGFVGCGSSE